MSRYNQASHVFWRCQYHIVWTPKLSISKLMGVLKGKIALKLFSKFPHLRKNRLWGNHFWQRGYFVDSVGINEEIIRRYVRHQEKQERVEQQQLALD